MKVEVPDEIFEEEVWKKIYIEPDVTESQRDELRQILSDVRHVFSISVNPISDCTIIQFTSHRARHPQADKTPAISGFSFGKAGNEKRNQPLTIFRGNRGLD